MRFEQLGQFISPSYTHFCLMSECVVFTVVIYVRNWLVWATFVILGLWKSTNWLTCWEFALHLWVSDKQWLFAVETCMLNITHIPLGHVQICCFDTPSVFDSRIFKVLSYSSDTRNYVDTQIKRDKGYIQWIGKDGETRNGKQHPGARWIHWYIHGRVVNIIQSGVNMMHP